MLGCLPSSAHHPLPPPFAPGVGKSSLLLRFADNTFSSEWPQPLPPQGADLGAMGGDLGLVGGAEGSGWGQGAGSGRSGMLGRARAVGGATRIVGVEPVAQGVV